VKSISKFKNPILVAVFLICFLALWHRVHAQGGGFITSTSSTFCTGTNNCVLTYHNDNNRDGVQSDETQLTQSHVQSGLSLVQAPTTDGLIFGQPLYIHGLDGSGHKVGTCTSPLNVVLVATENNSVYAFDASGNNSSPCWKTNFNQTNETAIPFVAMPNDANGYPCTDIIPELGITSTPVIDASVTPPVMYVASQHQITISGVITYDQRLHALNTVNGNELPAGYADISSTLGSSFNTLEQNQRAGVALFTTTNSSGDPVAQVYVASGSHCDSNSTTLGNYNGWVAEFQLD
jgi:hypothetical protein